MSIAMTPFNGRFFYESFDHVSIPNSYSAPNILEEEVVKKIVRLAITIFAVLSLVDFFLYPLSDAVRMIANGGFVLFVTYAGWSFFLKKVLNILKPHSDDKCSPKKEKKDLASQEYNFFDEFEQNHVRSVLETPCLELDKPMIVGLPALKSPSGLVKPIPFPEFESFPEGKGN